MKRQRNESNKKYIARLEAEARFMFTTIAIVELELRGDGSLAHAAVQQTLEQLGFSIIDQYENKCIKDGAYNA